MRQTQMISEPLRCSENSYLRLFRISCTFFRVTKEQPTLRSQRISAPITSDSKIISSDQHCTLPENLLTALIFRGFRLTFFQFSFSEFFFRDISKYLNFEAHNSDFQHTLLKYVSNKKVSVPSYEPKI